MKKLAREEKASTLVEKKASTEEEVKGSKKS
jgi:hypothetical protein